MSFHGITRASTYVLALASALTFLCLGAEFPAAYAESYPSKPIMIVVTFAAGSASDVNARHYGEALKEALNAVTVVDIRPGANGMIGARAVSTAKPDGYTLLMGSGSVNAANFALFADRINYKPSEFEPVALIYLSPTVLYATNDLPGDTIQEVVQNAAKAGRRLSCGSGNAVTQVACELLGVRAHLDMPNVSYRGNSQSLSDLAGGHISLAFADVVAAESLVSAGKIHAIAVPADKRLAASPNVKTFSEQGFANFEFYSWNALFVPVRDAERHRRKTQRSGRPHALLSNVGEAARGDGWPEGQRFH